MGAWNGWYHVNGNTYGTWLRGDPRGWRARHHREHVEGDYRNPPPAGMYEVLYRQSKRILKRPAIRLTPQQREIAGRAMVEMFFRLGIQILALSLNDVHYHLLAKFPDDRVRWPVGRAKKNASHALSAWGLKGTVWGKRSRDLPVKDRQHQVNVFRYILDHVKEGAWVWNYRQGLYWVEKNK